MMNRSIIDFYQQHVQQGDIKADPAQIEVLQAFQALGEYIQHTQNWWYKLPGISTLYQRIYKPYTGIYLYGSVGSGKTLLGDYFFKTLTTPLKQRLHFHTFMQQIHQSLRTHHGIKNPLHLIGKTWAKNTKILMLDEFFVDDIADAMLLGKLLDTLFAHHVVVIITSNIPPESLYLNGLQREQFLPTIHTIQQQLRTIELISQTDYRYRNAGKTKYEVRQEKIMPTFLASRFNTLSKGQAHHQRPLTILGRKIKVIKYAKKVCWCDFYAICDIPRSAPDYLILVKQFQYLLISHVVPIPVSQSNLALSLIKLVDIFYDQNKLIQLDFTKPLSELYPKGPHYFAFTRTKSRLVEMQTKFPV